MSDIKFQEEDINPECPNLLETACALLSYTACVCCAHVADAKPIYFHGFRRFNSFPNTQCRKMMQTTFAIETREFSTKIRDFFPL